MSLLNDPAMKKIIDDFCKESFELCDELSEILEEYSKDLSNLSLLEKYGQIIDRIMGAAKSIGAMRVGTLSELGKKISYKASQLQNVSENKELLNIVEAILLDTTEYIQLTLENIATNKNENISGFNVEAFYKRLNWLAEKFSDIERASVAVGDINDIDNIDDIEELLKQLKI